MTKSESAIIWAERIAMDNTHGYSNANRNGPNYDCSSFVNNAWQQSGVPVRTKGANSTRDMIPAYMACGFQNVTSSVNLANGAGMVRSDVLWSSGHAAMYCGNGKIVHARGDDGHPESGDQSGREICIDRYYQFATCVLRYVEATNNSDGTKEVVGAVNEKTIFEALKAGGLSDAGACGVMGNLWWESGGMIPNNVENRSGLNDAAYTAAVDNGSYSREQFSTDTFGFGLAQWTFNTRKAGLYDYAKSKGTSIGDPAMQCSYLLIELKRDFSSLYNYLCTTANVEEATKRFCKEFERPAESAAHVSERTDAAKKYFNTFAGKAEEPKEPEKLDPVDLEKAREKVLEANGVSASAEKKKSFWTLLLEILGIISDHDSIQPASSTNVTGETCNVRIKTLKIGNKGRDVFLLQCALLDMGISVGAYGADGDFGGDTEEAVKEFQQNLGLNKTGICDEAVWQAIFA